MDYVVKLVDLLAWPFVVIWLSFFFRKSFVTLVDRVSKLKLKDVVEADFTHEAQELEEKSRRLPSSNSSPRTHDRKFYNSMTLRGVLTQWEQINRIAKVSPKAAILEAWLDVDIAVSCAARHADIDLSEYTTTIEQSRELIEGGFIDKGVWPLITELNRLKNKAKNVDDFSLNTIQAEYYADSALRVGNTFRDYALAVHLQGVNGESQT